MSMNWLNKNQGAITIVVMLILGGWNLYLTNKADTREDHKTTEEHNKLLTQLEERVHRAQSDIEKSNSIISVVENKINDIDKNLAIVEEKLKNATIKSLMAAGATPKQALEFWNNPSLIGPNLKKDNPLPKLSPY